MERAMAEGEEERGNGGQGEAAAAEEEVGSSLTMERVAAAKQFIENHYRNQMKNIQERKERSAPRFIRRNPSFCYAKICG